MPAGLVGPAMILAFVLMAAPVVLFLDARERRLMQRVSALDAAMQGHAAGPERSIRRGRERFFWLRQVLERGLCYHAAIKVAYTTPIPLVLIAGLAVGVGAGAFASIALPPAVCAGLGVFVGCAVIRGQFARQRDRYCNSLLRQMPDTLGFVAGALRVGIPVAEAFRAVTREMPEPTRAQFVQVMNEVALGVPIHEAVLGVYRRTLVTEYAIFAVTIAVQTTSGGHLSETISTLAGTVRERILIAARAEALAGEGKVSAMILSALPVVAGTALTLIRPDYLDPLLHDPRGRRLFVAGVAMLVVGVWTMRRLITRAVRE